MKGRLRGAVVTTGLFFIVAFLLFLGGAVRHNLADRHPGYTLDLFIPAGEPRPLQVGFGAVAITPEVSDTWADENGNRWRDWGERYDDVNGNGRFDAVWLAGFMPRRPAMAVKDDLWARAIVIDDGKTSIAIVALDSIGLMHDRVVEIRKIVDRQTHVDYTIVCSTHSHATPDVQGLWGPVPVVSGVDPDYVERVVQGAAQSVIQAARSIEPAVLRCAVVPGEKTDETVTDSRRPIVKDSAIRILQALSPESNRSIGTFTVWGNHPETTRIDNYVSSDFAHSLRDVLENGAQREGSTVIPAVGGTAVYATGAIGGLMSTSQDNEIVDPLTGEKFIEPSFPKARAQGRSLGQLVGEALAGPDVVAIDKASIALRAHTLELPLTNRLLRLLAGIGVIDRGYTRFRYTRTEVAYLKIGPISLLAVPGEIYPEIVNGGIENPSGADFSVEPVEVPPLREQMGGEIKFVLGLANDAIGYIIPKSEWDNEEPWIYGSEITTYGEIVSLGSETAPLLHDVFSKIISELERDAAAAKGRTEDVPIS